MKKTKICLLILLTSSLMFNFVLAQDKENDQKNVLGDNDKNKEFEIKFKPEKLELRIPKLSKDQLGIFKKLDDFIRENIAEHPSASFFFLNPAGHAVQQGIVDEINNNILTVDSQGFKMSWEIATDTNIIASIRVSLLAQANPQPTSNFNIQKGNRVKVFGNWDGSKLMAKRIVVLERMPNVEIERLIERLKDIFRSMGIKIDLTPLLQQLQQR